LDTGVKKGKKDVEQLIKDYNYMMKEQLDEQRCYFVDRMASIKHKQENTIIELLRDTEIL
jgi:hypothetical protein